jgi:hypothetical protein
LSRKELHEGREPSPGSSPRHPLPQAGEGINVTPGLLASPAALRRRGAAGVVSSRAGTGSVWLYLARESGAELPRLPSRRPTEGSSALRPAVRADSAVWPGLRMTGSPAHGRQGPCLWESNCYLPHSALRTPHSALRTPHSALRTPHFRTFALSPSRPHSSGHCSHAARPGSAPSPDSLVSSTVPSARTATPSPWGSPSGARSMLKAGAPLPSRSTVR